MSLRLTTPLSSPRRPTQSPAVIARGTPSPAAPQAEPADPLREYITGRFAQTFGDLARDPARFRATLGTAFGPGFDASRAEAFRQQALAGDFSWLPPIRLVDSSALGPAAQGAYDAKTGVVYLNQDLARQPERLAQTYIEEVGHHLDTQLNQTDAAGDEGELFRRLLSGENLSQDTVRAIRAENDHGVIRVDGREVEVEFFLGKLVKKVGGAVKKAVSSVAGAAKKVVGTVTDTVKKVGGGILDGLKQIGGGVLKALGPIGKAIEGVGRFLNQAVGKFIQTFDMLSPALMLIPGIGPGLYAAYNVMKTTYYAANGDLKQAFMAGVGAFTGVGGMAGKVASMAQRGMELYETAKGVLKGDLTSILDLAGKAAGGLGGRMGATLGKATEFARAGLQVQQGLERGDIAGVLGGLSAGAGGAGQARWIDPQAAARMQEITAHAGRGANIMDAMLRGDAPGAIGAFDAMLTGLAPTLGERRTADLRDVLDQAARGASAFELLRSRRAADALDLFAGLPDGTARRFMRDGAEFARLVDAGDGAGMLRQLELLAARGGVHLPNLFDGPFGKLRAALDDASPLAMRTANALRNGLTDDAFDLVRRSVTALADGRPMQRAGMGLALSRLGYGLADALASDDPRTAMRVLDLTFAMAGATAPLAATARLGGLAEHLGNDDLASRAIAALLPTGTLGSAEQAALRELSPWMDRGAQMFGDVRRGEIAQAIHRLFALVEANGVALPSAHL